MDMWNVRLFVELLIQLKNTANVIMGGRPKMETVGLRLGHKHSSKGMIEGM